jgi:monovalent cation/hydrogen antiporter
MRRSISAIESIVSSTAAAVSFGTGPFYPRGHGPPARTNPAVSVPVLLFLGLVAAIAFAVVAKRLALPYPIVFVLAGTALAFIPGLPHVQISPDWIFLAVLPPLLFSGGWSTDWTMFRRNLRPIAQLAIGLVVVSTVVVAIIAEKLLPGLGWAAAFVLGAVVAPTDVVAASATFERFSVPRRVIAILEGEGLVNDATSLVIYAYAITAVTTGAFALGPAAGSFVLVTLGGIAVGCGVCWIVEKLAVVLRKYDLSDELIDSLSIIGAAYAAYLAGQALHVSGVLATVVAGITISRRSSTIYPPETRLLGENFWSVWIYLLNAFVFLAIGLQLRTMVANGTQTLALLPAALAVSFALIVVRLIWIYPAAIIPRWIPALRRRDPLPPWPYLTIIGWTGMRGIVSLAAALAIPFRTASGAPFPGRDAIVFITFVVIFVTLVGQGLSLIPLLRWLKVGRESDDGERRELDLRVAALEAGVRELEKLGRTYSLPSQREVLDRQLDEYRTRIEHLQRHEKGGVAEPAESRFDHEVQHAAIAAERRRIMELRDRGEVPDEIFRRVQYDLDLAEARLF